jgi:hypothetical protein
MRHEGREIPNALMSIFTPAELRVISVIFSVILSEGQCTKRLDEIAALAGASRSSGRNSIKEAVYHGILEPFVEGRSGLGGADHPALGFAPEPR